MENVTLRAIFAAAQQSLTALSSLDLNCCNLQPYDFKHSYIFITPHKLFVFLFSMSSRFLTAKMADVQVASSQLIPLSICTFSFRMSTPHSFTASQRLAAFSSTCSTARSCFFRVFNLSTGALDCELIQRTALVHSTYGKCSKKCGNNFLMCAH